MPLVGEMTKLQYEMLRIRMIEERIAKEYKKQEMRCPVHLSIGQEAPAVGVCAALTKEDKMVSTHRGHAHYLAKGGSLKGLIGELYGKSTGCSRGNGGSMHLIDLDVGFYGSTSIVGGTIPIGVGLAFGEKLKGSKATTVICFGDAAIEEGVFHESANFASIHKLNVIFFCENNLYSCYTHIDKRQPEDRGFFKVAEAHNLPYVWGGVSCESIATNVKGALKKGGPCFIEAYTYRHLQHCGPDNDDDLGYREKSEIQGWMALDPIKNITGPIALTAKGISDEIDEAFKEVKASPYPDKSEIGKYVYAPINI